jgi:hypothetical protein
MHGHPLRGVESSTAVKGDEAPHLRSPFADPCEPTQATSHEIHMHPRTHGLRGPAGPSEGSRDFRRRESPPRTDRAPLCRACVAREEDGCAPSAFPARTGMTYRANAMRQPLRSSVPQLPAKGAAAAGDRGAFHRFALNSFREDCSSLVRLKRALLPRGTGLTP